MNYISELYIKIFREIYKHNIRKNNKNTTCSIISQNFIGVVIYNNLGISFLSPTIKLFIEDKNFVKLVENLPHYMKLEPEPLTENYIAPIDKRIIYPKIIIGDIEVACLHYRTCNDAILAWNRKKKRVNFDNIYVIRNTWNLHNQIQLVRRLQNTNYKTIIFSTKECACEGTLQLTGDIWELDKRGIVRPNITDIIPGSYKKYFEEIFDYVSWLN